MHLRLLPYLCDPVDGSDLRLSDSTSIGERIEDGLLVSDSGRTYPIVAGIPRFAAAKPLQKSVASFGREWNHFNFDRFRLHWLKHIAIGGFGSPDYFAGKTIVDCAAGSGMQAKWMAESGAKHVIALELSDSVDGVMQENLANVPTVDIIQCSIDNPPIKANSIDGLVVCSNAIQHTPSVEGTARSLWRIVAPGSEFAFSCYLKYPRDPVWMARYLLVYRPLRSLLSRASFGVILAYAKAMAALRFIPGLGYALEQANFVVRGDVPEGERHRERLFESTVLNTFDWFGSHKYQHHLSAADIEGICHRLDPKPNRILNLEAFDRRPTPPGLPVRLFKTSL